jgi:hypothetical protein
MLQDWITAAVPWMTAGGFFIGFLRHMVIRPYRNIRRREEQCREERLQMILDQGREQTACLQEELRRLQGTAEKICFEIGSLNRRLSAAEIRLDYEWIKAHPAGGQEKTDKRPGP